MKVKEEARYKQLVEHLNDAVYTVDFKTLIFTSANPAAESLTGYSLKELLTIPVAKVVAPEHLPLVKKMINRKRKPKATIYEVDIIRKDGSRIPIEISSVAIYENNEPIEILGVARDITDRKIVEKQRNLFVSLISHEIKNPLTTILGYLSILQEKLKKDPTITAYLSTTYDQAKTINYLMNDFLEVSQMRLGKFKIQKQPFNLSETVQEVVKSYSAIRPIEVTGDTVKSVKADKNRIKQVLSNLISNAIKYSKEDKKIMINLTKTKKEVIVSVQDFGIGIPREEYKHIFEIFTRTKGAIESKAKGHGVGLYICREIIKFHKGKLWFESTLKTGSVFYFSIPIK